MHVCICYCYRDTGKQCAIVRSLCAYCCPKRWIYNCNNRLYAFNCMYVCMYVFPCCTAYIIITYFANVLYAISQILSNKVHSLFVNIAKAYASDQNTLLLEAHSFLKEVLGWFFYSPLVIHIYLHHYYFYYYH